HSALTERGWHAYRGPDPADDRTASRPRPRGPGRVRDVARPLCHVRREAGRLTVTPPPAAHPDPRPSPPSAGPWPTRWPACPPAPGMARRLPEGRLHGEACTRSADA